MSYFHLCSLLLLENNILYKDFFFDHVGLGHTPQKLPLWPLWRRFMPLSANVSTSSLTFQQYPTQSTTRLLSILMRFGIPDTASQCFACYLEGHSYQVTWKGSTSAPCRFCICVSQDSVLFFSFYSPSFGEVISSCGFSNHNYADDHKLA